MAGDTRPALFVDADDTLWENNIHYEQCIAEFAALMEAHGFDGDEAVQTMDEVERERVPVVGYAPQEFARSMAIAYRRLCERRGQPARDEVAERVERIGRAVIEYPILLLDGVEETLAQLSSRCRLFLLTKGDRAVQESKLNRSGLTRFFEAVHIVHEKDAPVFERLVAQHELRPEQTWMVGNSPRSDVNPAVEAGLSAIYVPHPNTWQFEVEQVMPSDKVTVLTRFAELLTLFPAG